MSRASDLRDEIVTELKARLSIDASRVQGFIVPDYTREELLGDEPIVGVRIGNRSIELNQGPDNRDVTIEIGVMGVLAEIQTASTPTKQQARTQQVNSFDGFDSITEEVIALWSPSGPLGDTGVAEHYPMAIEQRYAFDPDQLYKQGVYLALIEITYRDSEDN